MVFMYISDQELPNGAVHRRPLGRLSETACWEIVREVLASEPLVFCGFDVGIPNAPVS